MELTKQLNQNLSDRLTFLTNSGIKSQPLKVAGRLVRMVGMTLEVVGTFAPIGSRCQIMRGSELEPIEAEVVGFHDGRLFLMPIGDTNGLEPNAEVLPVEGGVKVGVGFD